jgi:hypothetical protein
VVSIVYYYQECGRAFHLLDNFSDVGYPIPKSMPLQTLKRILEQDKTELLNDIEALEVEHENTALDTQHINLL